jgi:hypothetical protein
MNNVLNLILCHLTARETEARLEFFKRLLGDCLLVYGGREAEFPQVAHEPKVLVRDERLLAGPDLQRNRQNYTGVFQAVEGWLNPEDAALRQERARYRFVNFLEFDHLPLTEKYPARLTERMEEESADVLGYRVRRIDGTSSPLFLNHTHDPRFGEFWAEVSVRRDRQVILQMIGTGHFWRRTAFERVARVKEPFPIYLELYLPSLAHHLGFRVRDLGREAAAFVRPDPLDEARLREAPARPEILSLHPVKSAADFKKVRSLVTFGYPPAG